MTCATKAAQAAEAKATAARLEECVACDRNEQGICLALKDACPDKAAIIEVGVKMPSAYCPIGKWGRIVHRQKCRQCGCVHKSADGVCDKCRRSGVGVP